jgi:hypothetical protein
MGAGFHIVGVGNDGKLWHTMGADDDGPWQSSFGSIATQSSGGPPSFSAVACGSDNPDWLQVVGLGSDGKLWHTIRDQYGTWSPSFGSIATQSKGGPSSFSAVGCAGAGGLQVVGLGIGGYLWHTIRYDNGTWEPNFGSIATQSKGGPPAFSAVACGSDNPGWLQVVGLGNDGKLWHTMRNSDGTWTPNFGSIATQSKGGPPSFSAVSCAGSSGLQVVGVGSDGKLWHTIRNDNGKWQPSFGSIATQTSGGPASFSAVACGTENQGLLHVVGLGNDGKLWHTFRDGHGTWTAEFEPLAAVSSGGPTSFTKVGGAGAVVPGDVQWPPDVFFTLYRSTLSGPWTGHPTPGTFPQNAKITAAGTVTVSVAEGVQVLPNSTTLSHGEVTVPVTLGTASLDFHDQPVVGDYTLSASGGHLDDDSFTVLVEGYE